jgi:hypothetical protein
MHRKNCSASLKIARAIEMRWTPQLPRWCGPGKWLKTPRKERRLLLANLRRIHSAGLPFPQGGTEGEG